MEKACRRRLSPSWIASRRCTRNATIAVGPQRGFLGSRNKEGHRENGDEEREPQPQVRSSDSIARKVTTDPTPVLQKGATYVRRDRAAGIMA